MTTSTGATQENPGLSYAAYTTNNTLQSNILDVVDAICSQDSTDRGAWTRVVAKRIALTSTYSKAEVGREIHRMLEAGRLYESCYEILFGTFPMTYVRNGNELLGVDISTTVE